MVTLLLEAGADIEKPGRDGLHPMHNAVAMGHKQIVALLIRKGAMVNSKDRLGRTPLASFAANKGSDMEIAKMLLAAGADPGIESAKDDDSYAPLDFAAGTGNLQLAELLIAAQVDVNHRTSDGSSALHIAAGTDHPEIVRLLIAHGADVNLTNTFGNTPIYYASNNPAMRQLLVASGAK